MIKRFNYTDDTHVLLHLESKDDAYKDAYLMRRFTKGQIYARWQYLRDLRIAQSKSLDELLPGDLLETIDTPRGKEFKFRKFGSQVPYEVIENIVNVIDGQSSVLGISRKEHKEKWHSAMRPTLDALVFKYKVSTQSILNYYDRYKAGKIEKPVEVASVEGKVQIENKEMVPDDRISLLESRVDKLEAAMTANIAEISVAIRELVSEYRERNRLLQRSIK